MTDQPASIFEDLEDLEKDKRLFFLWHKVKVARNVLGAICLLSVLAFVFIAATSYVDYFQLAVSILYCVCFYFSKKRPYVLLLIGTIVYIIMFPLFVFSTYYNSIDNTFIMPGFATLLGLFLRVIVIFYLARGTIAAKKYEELSKNTTRAV